MVSVRNLMIGAVAVVALAGLGAAGAFLIAPKEKADAVADQQSAADALTAARAAVVQRVPDAQSMSWGDIKTNWVGSDPAVCGWVDIHEPQDSFDGPERFVWIDGQVTLEEADGSDAVGRQWQAVCQSM